MYFCLLLFLPFALGDVCDILSVMKPYMTSTSVYDIRCGYYLVRVQNDDTFNGLDFMRKVKGDCKNILSGERSTGLRLPKPSRDDYWTCDKNAGERCFLFWDLIQEIQCLTNNIMDRNNIQWVD